MRHRRKKHPVPLTTEEVETYHAQRTAAQSPNVHAIALAHQARQIRLSAARLEQWAQAHATSETEIPDWRLVLIRRELSNISHNLTALQARF